MALRFFPVKSPERVGTAIKIAYHARFSTRVTFAKLSTTAYYDYGALRGLHTWVMVYHLRFHARLNFAVFRSYWGLYGSCMFGQADARLMNYTFPAWYL